MATNLARRDLFLGQVREAPTVLRPPYAIWERRFLKLCTGCGECSDACSRHLIRLARDNTPEMMFGVGACNFCGDCEKVCAAGALDAKRARPWRVIAHVRAGCLSFNGVVCRACGDNCEEDAIGFRLLTDGRSLPLVSRALCTGCGACAAVCPNKSMTMIEDDASLENEEKTV